jgi:hypothetical protein
MDEKQPKNQLAGHTEPSLEFKDGDAVQANITIPFTDSFTYSNCSALACSVMEFRISFAEALTERNIEPRVGIVMPPEHAAQLALNLIKQISFFERAFGPVRHPEWQLFVASAKDDVERDVQRGLDVLNVPNALYELRERLAELPTDEDRNFVQQAIADYENKTPLSRHSILRVVDLRRSLR